MNEVGLNAKWLKADLTHKKTQEFAKDVLNFMRNKLSDYQEKYGDLYNLEATPAESTTYRFAKMDKAKYPDIITAAKEGETPFYTNSSHLPVGYTSDLFEALDIQDDLQTLYTSGTVFHVFLGERMDSWQACASLVKKIAENYKLPYYTISPTYSICREHGYLNGEVKKCPYCGADTEVYSRITGYYRPVANWNDGKIEEYKHRKTYDLENSNLKCSQDKEEKNDNKIILVKTSTCPNCKMAETLLDKEKVVYEKLDANLNKEFCEEYGIKQAPTLVIFNKDKVKKITNISNIKKYLKETYQNV